MKQLFDEAHMKKVAEVYKRLHATDFGIQYVNDAQSAGAEVFGHVGGCSGPHRIDIKDACNQKMIALIAYKTLAQERFYIIEELETLGFSAPPVAKFKFKAWRAK